jgi:NADPH-dependent glutamate synthase beta subunit-like oxidoreductase/NAD-dependent dihydropyrimidine dehydrogenase PreA subunit
VSLSFKQITALSLGAESRSPLTSEAAQDFHWLRENVPCQAACPAGTDIPGYLEAIYHGRFQDAYEINLRDNVFPAILGRVCSRPCEAACRHGWEGNGQPVAICFSKRSAADFYHQRPIVLPPLFGPSGKRVAVVGGGVAGLTAARELARLGHAVALYEKHSTPGGMLNQGIPAFRLPRDLIEFEIGQVLAFGIELHCGVAVGQHIALEELVDGFDAVVVAAGTLRPNVPDLPGRALTGVEHGLSFLLQVNEMGRREVGRKAIVIGGGYTAMDCARAALRLGADSVGVFYRRSRQDMVVLPGELEEFLEEGGELYNDCVPVGLAGSNGKLTAVRFRRTRAGEPGRDGRRLPFEIAGSEFEVEADNAILATGQFPDCSWIGDSLSRKLVGSDRWLSSGRGQQTAEPKIFVAGDFALGASTLIQAIGHAKECAAKVDGFLAGRSRVGRIAAVGASFQSKVGGGRSTGRTVDMNVIPIHPMPTLPIDRRGLTAEVETGYEEPKALMEASRCYLCHYKFEIVDAKCVLCDECLKVKPVPGCIVEVAALLRDEEGRVTGYRRVEQGKTDSLYYNRLWIDQNQCVRCGQCESVCPVNAITIQKVSLETQLAE